MTDGAVGDTTTSPFAEWLDVTARAFGYRRDAELARKLELPQSTVSRWRKGSRPSVEHLIRVGRLFKTDITALLKLTGHAPPDLETEGLAESPQPPTEALQRINEADLPAEMKDRLREYWNARLNEERARLYSLIDAFQDGNETLPEPKAWLTAALESSVSDHLIEVFVTFTSIRQREGWDWPRTPESKG